MRAYYGSIISENRTVTPEGYLICLNVPIARTGVQQYLRSELGLDGDPSALIDITRTEDEVFSAATISSFEGKPVTWDHPPNSVNPGNIAAYYCGHAQNVRRGQGPESNLLIADLFITSKCLIEAIQGGMREVSCGYDCEYVQDDAGHIYQRSIRGNHVAIVAAGRAGSRVAIKDSGVRPEKINERGKTMTNKKKSLMARLFSHAVKDMSPDEISDTVEEISGVDEDTSINCSGNNEPKAKATDVPPDDEKETEDGDDALRNVLAAITELSGQIKTLVDTQSNIHDNADPLDALAEEVTGKKEETLADQEGAVTVPAEDIPDDAGAAYESTDEDEPNSQPIAPTANSGETEKAIALAAINAIKPVIAALPENSRKAASDRAAAEIRKMIGRDAKPKTNGYAGIINVMSQAARKRTRDAAKPDDGKLGQHIMATRNPHYKAKG